MRRDGTDGTDGTDSTDPSDRGRRDLVDKLRDLAVLRDKGVLSEGEFQRAKVEVLNEYHRPGHSGRGMT